MDFMHVLARGGRYVSSSFNSGFSSLLFATSSGTMTEESFSPPMQNDEVPRILYARKENDKHISHHSCKDWPTPPDPEVSGLI